MLRFDRIISSVICQRPKVFSITYITATDRLALLIFLIVSLSVTIILDPASSIYLIFLAKPNKKLKANLLLKLGEGLVIFEFKDHCVPFFS